VIACTMVATFLSVLVVAVASVHVTVSHDYETAKLDPRRRLRHRSSPYRSLHWKVDPGSPAFAENHKRSARGTKAIYGGGLRCLAFGGPSTYGKGLENTRDAYPYLLSPPTSEKNKEDRVHNVAHSSFETGGATLASLCTQSIVEGNTNINQQQQPKAAATNALLASESGAFGNSDLYESHANRSSAFDSYDVITLEYASSASATEDPLSSIGWLARRLRQRYPLATIVLVRLWTPSDLVYYDPVSNRTVSYSEWRGEQQRKTAMSGEGKATPSDSFAAKRQQERLREAMKEHAWAYRDLSPSEQTKQDDAETTMHSEIGLLVHRMARPNSINDFLETIADWFLEETENADSKIEIENNIDASSLLVRSTLRYTLSREGHAVVADGLRELLGSPPRRVVPAASAAPGWGSGDSCQLWYEKGNDDLPGPGEYSDGLQPNELFRSGSDHAGEQQLTALEVRGGGGALRVRNPFESDRVVYLTYLTTSASAAANKVYPKTRVRVVMDEARHGLPRPRPRMQQSPVSLSSVGRSPSIILDPSHDDENETHGAKHRTRTSAVGLVSARSTGVLELTPLEQYTVHPFRLVGVSFLASEKTAHDAPFEFALSLPRSSLSRVETETTDDKITEDVETNE